MKMPTGLQTKQLLFTRYLYLLHKLIFKLIDCRRFMTVLKYLLCKSLYQIETGNKIQTGR